MLVPSRLYRHARISTAADRIRAVYPFRLTSTRRQFFLERGARIRPFASLGHFVAWLAFMAALGLVIGSMLDLVVHVAQIKAAPALTDPVTPVPVKVAYYVPPPQPTAIPTILPTRTPTPAPTPTRTRTPTLKPSVMPSITRTPTAPARLMAQVVTPTATSTAVAVIVVTPTASVSPPVVSLGESYGLVAVLSPQTDRPAARMADLNLALRGYMPVSATLSLVDYWGDADGAAPQLDGLFGDHRTPDLVKAFQVYDWNWSCDCRAALLSDPLVTLVGIKTAPGEVVRVPAAGTGLGNGYQVLVLYADNDRITLKYTRSDSVKDGYALHVESISIDAGLVSLYRQADDSGRAVLPALKAGQGFGRARGTEIRLAIRDTGTFMDPRSRKDWWRGH